MAWGIESSRWVENQDASPIPKSTEADKDNRQEASQTAAKLTKANTILEALDFEFSLNEEKEKEYKDKLLTKTPEELDELSNKTPEEIIEELNKVEIKEINPQDSEVIDNWDENINSWTIEEQIINIKSQINELNNKLSEATSSRDKYNLRKEIKFLEVDLKELEANKEEKEIDETQSEITEEIENKETSDKLKIIQSAIPKSVLEKHGDIAKLLEGFEELDNEERQKNLDEIIKILKDPGKLKSLSDDLGWVWSKEYETFKNSMISIDGSLAWEFDKYETEIIPNKSSLVVGTLWDIKVSWDTLTSETDDWFQITAWEDSRTLSLNWSDYKLDADIGNRDERREFDEVEKEIQTEAEPINKELNSISKIITYLQEAIDKALSLNDVKNEIANQIPFELYNEIGVENATSIQEIKSRFDWIYAKKKEDKEKLLEEKREKLDDIIRRSNEIAREKDEKIKSTLKFLRSIWFDLIPQDVSTEIIRLMNLEKWMYGMQENIDLANWNLWFKEANWDLDSVSNKKKFAELINVMISGEKGKPININSVWALWNPTFIWEDGKVADYNQISKDILNKLWAHSKSVILGNMEKFKKEGK